MGTNYYAIPKADEETKAKIIEAIKNELWGEARSIMPESIHIGKSSMGWQFLFNHHDWQYFDKTQASIAKFLDNCVIYDSYNETITPNQFWVMVDRKREHRAETQYGFIEDGLVFSDSTDFS